MLHAAASVDKSALHPLKIFVIRLTFNPWRCEMKSYDEQKAVMEAIQQLKAKVVDYNDTEMIYDISTLKEV